MSDTIVPTPAVKRTTRRKTASIDTASTLPTPATTKNVRVVSELFADLLSTIAGDKTSFDELQKEIIDIRESWIKEQARHETAIRERDQQEDLEKRRDREAYEYEVAKKRREEEDIFSEKKAKWEKELTTRRDEIEQDKKELEFLRKQVDSFEDQLAKAVKEARESLSKELTGQFMQERKLADQEVKAEKELAALKITTLIEENQRQAKEIEALKKALDDATAQLKDIAVKVIESSGNQKLQGTSES